jgi:hypothetical protein
MKTRRRIIVYIATSADGYIARLDGDVERLNRRPRDSITRSRNSKPRWVTRCIATLCSVIFSIPRFT